MSVSAELYSLHEKAEDKAKKLLEEWNENFDWLEEVLLSAKDAQGETVIPKTPAARRGKRKRKPSIPDEEKFVHPAEVPPATQRPKRKKGGASNEINTSEKNIGDDMLNNSTSQASVEQNNNEISEVRVTRKTTRSTVTRKYSENNVSVAKESLSTPANTKQKTKKAQKNNQKEDSVCVADTEIQENDKSQISSPAVVPETENLKLAVTASIKAVRTYDDKKSLKRSLSQTNEVIDEVDHENMAAAVEVLVECTPKQRILRSRANTPNTPQVTVSVNTPRKVQLQKTPTIKSSQKENVETNLRDYYSPCKSSARLKNSENKGTSSDPEAHSKVFRAIKTTAKKAKVHPSPLSLSTVKSQTKGSAFKARTSKAPYTPPVKCRTKNFPSNLCQSSGSLYRHRPLLQGASPLIGKMVRAPSDLGRQGNLVTGVTSLLSRVMPRQPTKEDIEHEKQVALQKKKEKQAESFKKKEELLKLRTIEQKRKNEERMRKVQEARLNQEKEKRQKEEERIRFEREKKFREEERIREEKEKKKRLIAAKVEAESLKIARIKAQQEEEQRLRQEQAIREEEHRKLQEMKQKMETQKRILEQTKEAQLRQEMEAIRIAKEKQELDKIRAQETQRQNLATTPAPMDATYSKSPITNYQITPVPPPKPFNADNYDIDDRCSDDSTDNEDCPKKDIPAWAEGTALKTALFKQKYYAGDITEIFPPEDLLIELDLSDIFRKKRSRFYKRTSSAIWDTPPRVK